MNNKSYVGLVVCILYHDGDLHAMLKNNGVQKGRHVSKVDCFLQIIYSNQKTQHEVTMVAGVCACVRVRACACVRVCVCEDICMHTAC